MPRTSSKSHTYTVRWTLHFIMDSYASGYTFRQALNVARDYIMRGYFVLIEQEYTP